MSLENSIEQLIVAVHALTDALDNARKATPVSQPVAPAVPNTLPAVEAPAVSFLSYEDDVQPQIRAKAKSDRKAVVALLGEYGAETGADLKPEQYEEFLARLAKT